MLSETFFFVSHRLPLVVLLEHSVRVRSIGKTCPDCNVILNAFSDIRSDTVLININIESRESIITLKPSGSREPSSANIFFAFTIEIQNKNLEKRYG